MKNIDLKNYGKKKVLSRAERATKYETELLTGYKITNTFELKKRNGRKLPLGKTDISYRKGFLKALNKE